MSLKDIQWNLSYETTENEYELLEDFYVPALQQAIKYYRITGFFTSSSLIMAAKGIEGLIQNGGKMYLLVSPQLSEEDWKIISEHGKISEKSTVFAELMNDLAMPDERLQALGWLLDIGRLEIKIVVRNKSQNSIFHEKIGILFDKEGNVVSFSGSINETAAAWVDNVEEFKVFCSWKDGQQDYVAEDLKKFTGYWKNQKPNVAQVYEIPDAVKKKLISMKPRDINDLNIMARYRREKKREDNKLSLFPHQQEAVEAWLDNGKSLLFEMCTSAGKTRTAIGCMMRLVAYHERFVAIVSTPQSTLTKQWQSDMEKLNISLDAEVFADGSNSKKWSQIELMLMDVQDKKIRCGIIYTTHDTSSNPKFLKILQDNSHGIKYLFIGDEVHATGSTKRKLGLLDCYNYRIGLSATPERMFDEAGTSFLINYFGNKSYEFTIEQGLHTIRPGTNKPFLNRYIYKPVFVELTDKETQKYNKLTQQIIVMRRNEDHDPDELQKLYERRANIGKNAENKKIALEEIIAELNPVKMQDTILFVSPQQIDYVMKRTGELGIKRAEVTEKESTSKKVNDVGDSERQDIINQFRARRLQMLVGIKCMDEGIDIKNARIAVLMSNSTNPREYIQRIGRVVRQDDNKPVSVIYDMIVYQNEDVGGSGLLEKESKRASYIAKNSENYDEVIDIFKTKGVDLDVY